MSYGLVIFDLDGCISNDHWRRSLIPDWSAYHAGLTADKVANEQVVWRHASEGAHLLFITARPERYSNQTLDWLTENLGVLESFSLLMRPEGDKRTSPELKVALFEQWAADENVGWENVVAAYDDRQDVLDSYERSGCTNALRLLASPEPTVPNVLRSMAKTFEERNAVYGDNYKRVGAIMRVLWPDGVPGRLATTDHFHLFELIIVKVTRFAISELKHLDSAHDMAVYAAMIESVLKGDKT